EPLVRGTNGIDIAVDRGKTDREVLRVRSIARGVDRVGRTRVIAADLVEQPFEILLDRGFHGPNSKSARVEPLSAVLGVRRRLSVLPHSSEPRLGGESVN